MTPRLAIPLLGLCLLIACDDHLLGAPHDVDADGWCGVQQVFTTCTGCHGVGGQGGLDLATDPHAAVVGVTSAADPSWVLVEPGDPDASLLLLKMQGSNPAGTGGEMPPGTGSDDTAVEIVRAWIEAGADAQCDTSPTSGRFHPDDWALPENHGLGAKLQQHECITCHGDTLEGATGPSCDSCHVEGWRTDCTWCHGDPDEGSGAPPVHIRGTDEGDQASFVPHLAHTQDTDLHTAFACDTCHQTPTDVLSAGHLFVDDDTPGVAEVDLSAGLSSVGSWDGNGTCSNLYCHGNGQGPNGTMVHTDTVTGCADCHPDATTPARWEAMSGRHDDHLAIGIACADCHPTAQGSTAIADPSLHVDKTVQLDLGSIVQAPNGDCTGFCHGQGHTSDSWD